MEIDKTAVRSVALGVNQAALKARSQVPSEIGEVGQALRGSASATAATALATVWSQAYTGWADQADAHARAMHAAANDWESADQSQAANFQALGAGQAGKASTSW